MVLFQMNAMIQSNSGSLPSTDEVGGLVFDKIGGQGTGGRPYQARATSSYQQDTDLQVSDMGSTTDVQWVNTEQRCNEKKARNCIRALLAQTLI
jgi:hypothetical protein